MKLRTTTTFLFSLIIVILSSCSHYGGESTVLSDEETTSKWVCSITPSDIVIKYDVYTFIEEKRGELSDYPACIVSYKSTDPMKPLWFVKQYEPDQDHPGKVVETKSVGPLHEIDKTCPTDCSWGPS